MENVAAVRALAEAGFYVTDVNVTFAAATADIQAARGEVAVMEARPDQQEAVLDIAGTAFRYSRFHLDPLLRAGLADRIKREWIRSYFQKARGDRLLVALVDDRPAGFLAALVADRPEETVAVIDLIGVARDRQGRGVGRALVAAFAECYRGRCPRSEVGTQIANLPSLAFYEGLGFRLVGSQYVLHRHVGPA